MSEPTTNNNTKLNILIVDDVQMNREVLALGLTESFNIIEASDGVEAIEIMKERLHDISMIFLDIMMPRMDGVQVLQHMQAQHWIDEVPVIMISSDDSSEHIQQSFELGASDFISKNINPKILKNRIENILRLFSRQAKLLETVKEENNKLAERNARLHFFDQLTECFNLDGFLKASTQTLQANSISTYALWYFNIRKFSIINSYVGFNIGNVILKTFASILKKNCDPKDVVGRFHGDTFLVLMKYYDNNEILEYFRVVSESIKGCLKEYGKNFSVEIMAGFYCIDPEKTDKNITMMQLVDYAKLAMSAIQDKKGSYFSAFDEQIYKKQFRDEIISQMLESSIKHNEIVAYYQPQFNFQRNEIVGMEALCRWKHPTLGFISPAEFIPVLEHTGQIVTLDYCIWEQACAFIKKLCTDGDFGLNLHVSVNISRFDILAGQVYEKVNELVAKYKIPPTKLHLEITESAYMDKAEVLIDSVKRLQKAGFIVEMDDFGSGYSSLNMLKDVPVNVLKLDLRFLSDDNAYREKVKGDLILKSMVQMAKNLNINVIAEGVETKEQALFLSSIGAQIMQGFYFARPMPSQDIEDLFLKESQKKNIAEKALQNKREDLISDSNAANLEQGRKFVTPINFCRCVITTKGQFLELSEEFTNTFGYKWRDIIDGKISYDDIIPHTDLPAFFEHVNNALLQATEEEKTCLFKHRIQYKAGKIDYVYCFGTVKADFDKQEEIIDIRLVPAEEIKRVAHIMHGH